MRYATAAAFRTALEQGKTQVRGFETTVKSVDARLSTFGNRFSGRKVVQDAELLTAGVRIERFHGGLLHTNIASCAVFSAISGSSVATAATMGSVALPYFEKSHYPPKLVLGSLAADVRHEDRLARLPGEKSAARDRHARRPDRQGGQDEPPRRPYRPGPHGLCGIPGQRRLGQGHDGGPLGQPAGGLPAPLDLVERRGVLGHPPPGPEPLEVRRIDVAPGHDGEPLGGLGRAIC